MYQTKCLPFLAVIATNGCRLGLEYDFCLIPYLDSEETITLEESLFRKTASVQVKTLVRKAITEWLFQQKKEQSLSWSDAAISSGCTVTAVGMYCCERRRG